MAPHHILIVEDDLNTAEMLMAYFGSQNYQVTAVEYGQQALDFVQETVPDLVVLDIRLPDIDGYEICRQLRSQRRTAQVPILFLTERRERIDRLVGLELGAVDYVTKPFDIQELRLRVRNILRRVKMDHLVHPVTGLPFSALADENLSALLKEPQWAIVSVELDGLKDFAEDYGFVARDDVMRAVALIIQRVTEELGGKKPFVGQLDDQIFYLSCPPESAAQVENQLHKRLEEAMHFFYPRSDWSEDQEQETPPQHNLSVFVSALQGPGSYKSPEDLREAIQRSFRKD